MTDDWQPTYEERMALAAKPDALADWRVTRQAAAKFDYELTPRALYGVASFGMEDHQHQMFIEDCASCRS